MSERPAQNPSARLEPPAPWDDARVARLGTAFVAAGNRAHIGLAVVRRELPESLIVYVSEAGADIMGHPREQILNRPARAFLSQAEQELYRPPPDATAPPPIVYESLETWVVSREGRSVPCEVTLAPVEFEGESLVVVFFRDISERQRVTQALRQSEERFRALIEHAPDAIWVNDGERLLYVNSASVRMLGYDSIEELLSRSALDIVHPADHPALRERIVALTGGEKNLPPKEYRTVRKDGSVFTTEVQTLAIDWEDRKVILGVARDVTARKEIEAKLGQSDRLAALGTLLAGIAHEMNNPLAYVMLGIEQALRALDGARSTAGTDDGSRADGAHGVGGVVGGQGDGNGERGRGPGGGADRSAAALEGAGLREILRNVQQGAERVASIVRQLRASSRRDGSGQSILHLREVLESALRVAGNEIRHRARLVTSFEDVPPTHGDPQRLEQVFLNLLVNAAHALPDGRLHNEVHVSLYGHGSSEPGAVVEIRDNGTGIAPEILPRIFDPFFTTKPVGVGTGLGLSICHSIVAAHGGSIDVESVPNVRTTFRVRLPIREHPASPPLHDGGVAEPSTLTPHPPGETAPAGRLPRAPRAATASADLSTRGKRILIVDDEPVLADLILRLLRETCQAEVVPTGRRALERIAEVGTPGYDVILCDLMMPGMTGMDLYGTVARQWPGLERRFVFMTGGAFTSQAADFLASVRVRRLDKPFDVATLRAAVHGGE